MKDTVIIGNQVECLKCGDKPYSGHRHDMSSCKCGAISVDGGTDYLKRSGDLTGYIDLSIVIDKKLKNKILESLKWSTDNGRNDYGRLCAIFRAIRDTGHKVVSIDEKS